MPEKTTHCNTEIPGTFQRRDFPKNCSFSPSFCEERCSQAQKKGWNPRDSLSQGSRPRNEPRPKLWLTDKQELWLRGQEWGQPSEMEMQSESFGEHQHPHKSLLPCFWLKGSEGWELMGPGLKSPEMLWGNESMALPAGTTCSYPKQEQQC